VGTTANRYAALQSGTIDATNLTPPYNFKAQEAGLRELVAFVKEDYLVDLAGTIVVRESLFQSDPAVIEKLIRGMLKGLFHIRQSRSSTIPILAKLMKTQDNVAEKIYDMVLPGLTTDGSLNPEVQKRVIDFVSRVQGIQEPVTAEKVFDFSSVRRIRADLEIKKWKPIS
jgi:ABC-type nitrate/sulfonate/bicarbonate transport system substrate-binding protein